MDLLKLEQSIEPKIMSTAALIESAVQAATATRDPKNDIEAITRKLLLKNLLTLPSSSSAAAFLAVSAPQQPQPSYKSIAPISTVATTTAESMITKEINDAQLNLTKILYEPDEKLETETKEKDHDFASTNGQNTVINDSQMDDDDQSRLVIDISDDEKKEKRKKKSTREKILTTSAEEKVIKIDRNQLPKSITYNLETSTSGVSSSVKIDILASNSTQPPESAPITNMKKSSKSANITVADELNLLGHEIDRQMGRKTNEILELIKAFISNAVTKKEFHEKMTEIGNVSMSDLTLIARKVIKRYKFEQNPNQQLFAKMKFLQFPTGGKDLVNYFENLLPTLSRDKFINMIKFYEIIIKEMLNLNRTKILQYLIDFMVKKKNSQLDLLNFNYLASSGCTAESNASQTCANVPGPTQQPPSEKKPLKFFDTSYNFVLRSDPIYIMACSKFHTIIRNVIRCRCSSCIQVNSFERRPFDNNILRNRRIGKRLVNEREDLKEVHIIPEKIRRPNEGKSVRFLTMPTKIQNSSPILVSDTPPPSENSSPPVIHAMPVTNIEKPRIIHQYVIQRAFSERPPPVTTAVRKLPTPSKELPKLDFPQITPETPPIEKPSPIKQPAKRRISAKSFDPRALSQASVVVNGETTDITLNELKTLSDNGTEIIPSSARNSIASRRKTVDERAQVLKTSTNSVEVRKITQVPPMSEPIKPTAESAHRAMMKRRQSCHERILANTATQKTNESNNIEQRYVIFLKTQYENKKRMDDEQKMKQMQAQNQQKVQEEAKRVRFENVTVQNPQIIRPSAQYVQAQLPAQVFQHQLLPRAPAFYEQHQKFVQERIYRERFYDQVEPLQDHDQGQQNNANQKTTSVPQQKSPRIMQRTPVASDEKMMMVAYQQLQSLRDSSTIGLQQYAEQLKNLHQFKPGFIPGTVLRQNSQEPPREIYYPNTQQHSQGVTTTTVAQLQHFYQPSVATTTVTTSATSYPISSTDQSLQKKLKLKSKTLTNYVEPNQPGKPFYNPPNSTYYSDPYAPAIKKTPPIPTTITAFHPTQVQSQAQVERRNSEMHVPQQQFQNFWMLQQQHQQQVHHHQQQQQQNSQPNIARPIPISRGQSASAFMDPKNVQNAATIQAQAFHHDQSEYYRQYYQHHHPKSY